MENYTLPARASDCNKKCPICCGETLAEIQAKAEAHMRLIALYLSGVCIMLLMIAHFFFTYNKVILTVPEILWVIVLAPWCGEGVGKLAGLLKK